MITSVVAAFLSYLPNRQLRKEEQIAELKQKGYLPNRQLRK